jgi:hypothetical protein
MSLPDANNSGTLLMSELHRKEPKEGTGRSISLSIPHTQCDQYAQSPPLKGDPQISNLHSSSKMNDSCSLRDGNPL